MAVGQRARANQFADTCVYAFLGNILKGLTDIVFCSRNADLGITSKAD